MSRASQDDSSDPTRRIKQISSLVSVGFAYWYLLRMTHPGLDVEMRAALARVQRKVQRIAEQRGWEIVVRPSRERMWWEVWKIQEEETHD